MPDEPTQDQPGGADPVVSQGDPSTSEDISVEEDAPALALQRQRAAARARGLRPGLKPMRRRRPGVPSAPSTRRGGRDPELLGDEVEALVRERAWQVDVAAGAVMGRWDQIVGADVALHARPTTFEQGVLTVRADSTAWATNLRLMEATLLGRIEAEVGRGVVGELRIVGPSAPSWSRGPRKVSDGRGPRDTYG